MFRSRYFAITLLLCFSSSKVGFQAGFGQFGDPHGLSLVLGFDGLAVPNHSWSFAGDELLGSVGCSPPLSVQLPPHTQRHLCASGDQERMARYWARMQGLVSMGYLAPGHPHFPAAAAAATRHLSADALFIVSKLVQHGLVPPFNLQEEEILGSLSTFVRALPCPR